MISETSNSSTEQIIDLNSFNEKKLNSYYNEYIESLKSIYNIKEHRLIKTQNKNIYIAYEVAVNDENSVSYNYDTLLNQKLISINITLPIDSSFQKANDIIEKVEYKEQNESLETKKTTEYAALISVILIIIVIGIKVFIKKRKDVPLNGMQIVKFEKIRGWLLVYTIAIISIIIVKAMIISLFSQLLEYAPVLVLIAKETITAILYMFTFRMIFKKKEKTPIIIGNILFGEAIANLIMFLLIECSGYSSMYMISKEFYISTIVYMIAETIFNIAWIIYFKKSARCQSRYRVVK